MSTARKINKLLQMKREARREGARQRRQTWFMVFTNPKLRGRRNYIGFPFRVAQPATPVTVETDRVVRHRLPGGAVAEIKVRQAVHAVRSLYAPHQGKAEIARRRRQIESLRVPPDQMAEACGPAFKFLRDIEIKTGLRNHALAIN